MPNCPFSTHPALDFASCDSIPGKTGQSYLGSVSKVKVGAWAGCHGRRGRRKAGLTGDSEGTQDQV